MGKVKKLGLINLYKLQHAIIIPNKKSVLARMPSDQVAKQNTIINRHQDFLLVYQKSNKGIEVLVISIRKHTIVLSNYEIKLNKKGGVYVKHPSINNDLSEEEATDLFIEQ